MIKKSYISTKYLDLLLLSFGLVYVVTPANFNPTKLTKSSPLLSRKPFANRPSIAKKIIKESSEESSEEVDESIENEDDDVVIKDNSHWRTESNFRLSDGLSVTKYKSNLTGQSRFTGQITLKALHLQ